jgi:hypothetical protein
VRSPREVWKMSHVTFYEVITALLSMAVILHLWMQ